jgi:hypothetical protein
MPINLGKPVHEIGHGIRIPRARSICGVEACSSIAAADPSGEPKGDLENFDFTLPGDVTDYVVSVRFDEKGEIDSLCMES